MLEATINILGYDMTFTEEECQSYDDMTEIIATEAPEGLLMKLNGLPRNEFVDLMSDILVDLTEKLDMDREPAENKA